MKEDPMGIISGGKVIEGALGRVSSSAPAEFSGEGAPVADETEVGVAAIGDRYTNTTNGKVYVVTATNGDDEITWTVVGTQT
jgi:hypothetical protein